MNGIRGGRLCITGFRDMGYLGKNERDTCRAALFYGLSGYEKFR